MDAAFKKFASKANNTEATSMAITITVCTLFPLVDDGANNVLLHTARRRGTASAHYAVFLSQKLYDK